MAAPLGWFWGSDTSPLHDPKPQYLLGFAAGILFLFVLSWGVLFAVGSVALWRRWLGTRPV